MPRHEVYAHYELLKRGDGGRAFLRIMRGFELTEAKQRFLWEGLAERPYPARIVWGERDPALGLDQLRVVQQVLGVDDPILLPAKHFLQEDQATAVGPAIADLAAPLGLGASGSAPAPAARAPFSTSRGSPRSGKGISTRSKSRGASVAGNSSRASASTSRTS